MTNQPLSGLPDRLEQLGSTLSETLYRAHADLVGDALVRAGVIHAEAAPMLRQAGVVEQQLDVFAVLALYGDCLTLVTLACANALQPLAWDRFEGLRPLLQRIGGFLAAVNPRYKDFRAVPREKIGELLNAFAAGREVFGLLNPATHWQGLRLCAHVAARHNDPLARSYLDQVLRPIWQHACTRAEVPAGFAAELWVDLQARFDRSSSTG